MRLFQIVSSWFYRPKKPTNLAGSPKENPTRVGVTSDLGRTTGERHKNPLNVKAFKGGSPAPDYWRFQAGVDTRGHAIFNEVPHGLRAAIITLRTYWQKHRLRTIASILSRWAPASDTVGFLPNAPANSPAEYSRFVSRWMEVGPNDILNIFTSTGEIGDATQLFELVSAMAAFENYSSYRLSSEDFLKAIAYV